MGYIAILDKIFFRLTSLIICFLLLLTNLSPTMVLAALNPALTEVEERKFLSFDTDESEDRLINIEFNNEIFTSELAITEVNRIDTSADIVSILNQKANKTISYPMISDKIIAMSCRSSNATYSSPYFFKIGENIIYKLEVNTLNKEPINIDNGALIYRDYNKNLLITNVSDEISYGLKFGESKQINPAGFEVGQFAVKDGRIVFCSSLGTKEIHIFKEDFSESKLLFSISGSIKNPSISIYNEEAILWWGKENKIYYVNLDELERNDDYKLPTTSEIDFQEYFSVSENKVIFINNNDKLYLQKLDVDSEAEYLCETAPTDIYIDNNLVLYVDKNKNLSSYNYENGDNHTLYNTTSMPLRIASNGRDIVWVDNNHAYWLAGLKKLEIINIKNQLLEGEIIPLSGKAIYNNNFISTKLEEAVWSSSNEQIICVNGNKLIAMAHGEAEVSLKYKGTKISHQVLVKEISPPAPKANNKSRSSNSINTNTKDPPVLSAEDLSIAKRLYFYNRYSYLYLPWYILGEGLGQINFFDNDE